MRMSSGMDSGMGLGIGSRRLQISPNVSGCLGVWQGVCLVGCVAGWVGAWWVVFGWESAEQNVNKLYACWEE